MPSNQRNNVNSFNLNLLVLIVAVLVVIMQLRSCIDQRQEARLAQQVSTQVIVNSNIQADQGLDLQAVGSLLAQAKDAQSFEELLNQPGGVNNLDLNDDGVVDYIKVTEYGSGDQRGFSLSVDLADGEEQEVATIEFQKQGQQADVQIRGNQDIYGNNYYYTSRFGLGDMLFFSWLFSASRPYYYSPWGWGYYPPYYGRGYATTSYTRYRQRASSFTQQNRQARFQSSRTGAFTSRSTSPNSTKNAYSQRSPLRSGTSQRSFSSGTRNSSSGTTGTRSTGTTTRSLFGGSTSQKSFSIRNSSSAFRSGSSFGGGK